MESLSLPSHQTLLHNSTNHLNHSSPMENFQQFISRLAETRPNNPLTPPAKTLLHRRFNQFVSDYKTPDHPPYSAMIQMALEELNEKRGSSEESISQYLEKRYGNLPWAHSELLKHHLKILCESNEIIVTREKRYRLPGHLNLSPEVKKKPGRRKRRWRYDWERERNNRLRLKKKLSKKKNKRTCEKDEEQSFTENEDKSEAPKTLLSCVVEKEYPGEMFPSRTIEVVIGTSQQEGIASEHSELLSGAERPPEIENKQGCTKTISPEHEDTLEGKHLGRRLRPRRAKTEVSKDEDFVACTSELLQVIFKPKPDPADVNGRKRQVDCASPVREKTEPPQRRLRFRVSNPKRKVQVRRGRPPKRRAD